MEGITLPDGTVVPTRRPVGRPQLPPGQDYFHPTPELPLQRIKWTHDLVIDVLVQNPHWTHRELAAHFGYTPSWVYTVTQSDAFQAKLAERRDEILDPRVKADIEARFRALASHSLDRLHEKLENPNASDNLVLRSVEVAAKALGLGARAPSTGPSVQIAIVVPPKAPDRG